MNNDFKYILEPYKGIQSRYICPRCQKKNQFARYIDQQSKQPLADHVGRCNRADKCEYHYTPKQYFEDNKHLDINFDKDVNDPKPDPRPLRPIVEPEKEKPISTIPIDVFKKTRKAYQQNNFVFFLTQMLGKELATEIIGLYHLGTSKHWEGATIFWQIDIKGNIRAGKVMLYNPETGKRVKEPYQHITWIHKIAKLKDYNLNQCLYGEHLLKLNPEKPIAIVESEKTAMIASGHLPQFNWLATGNLNNFSAKMVQCLKGKSVILYPDAGVYHKWLEKAEQLKDVTSFTVSNLIETSATPAQLKEGYDLADYLTDKPKFTGRNECEQTQINNTEEIIPEEGNQSERTPEEEEENDSFFEEIKQRGGGCNPKELWPVDELEKYFNSIVIPKDPIKLNDCTILENPSIFITSHLMAIKNYNGNKIYKPYLERLLQLKTIFENIKA